MLSQFINYITFRLTNKDDTDDLLLNAKERFSKGMKERSSNG